MQYPQVEQLILNEFFITLLTSSTVSSSSNVMDIGVVALAIARLSSICSIEFIPERTQLTFLLFSTHCRAHWAVVLLGSAFLNISSASLGIFPARIPPFKGSITKMPIPLEAAYSIPSTLAWTFSSK